MTNRPRIEIPLTDLDKLLNTIGWIAFLILIGIPFYFFDQLPDQIPIHFNSAGEVDKYGSKNTIWLLPIIGTITYLGLKKLNKYPHTFNYPKRIPEGKAELYYTLGTRMIRVLNTTIVLLFSYLVYCKAMISFGNKSGLSPAFLPIVLIAIFLPIGYYTYKMIDVQS